MMDTDQNKIMTDVTAELIKDAATSGWKKVKKFFRDLDAQSAIQCGDAYTTYLENTGGKYGKIKTLLYRRVPKGLYDFYECIGVRCDGQDFSAESVQNLLEVSNKILITGTGGSGKSILFKHLFLNTVKSTEHIPVLIELRRFNTRELKDISLADEIYRVLNENGFALEREYFDFSMEEGAYVILLDGFDEINRDRVARLTEEIKGLSTRYGKNSFLVSSRPSEQFIGWNDFTEMTALPMTKEQALRMVARLEFDEPVKATFYKELENGLFEKYRSFASNPLLLTIMLLTFDQHAAIPEKLNDFYETAFTTLFNQHDATKDCYVRDIRTKLGCEDFKTVFSYFCFKSYFKGEYEFSERVLEEHLRRARAKFEKLNFSADDFREDLTGAVCMLVKDGQDYRFIHRSFQEYFAASYTCKLTDEVQAKLLSRWLMESSTAKTDEYLPMLFDLQPDKVNEIVLCPGIKKLQEVYKQYGFSVPFLEALYGEIWIDWRSAGDEKTGKRENRDIWVTIENEYLCAILSLTCRLNGYSGSGGKYDAAQEELMRRLSEKTGRETGRWPFREVCELGLEEQLLAALGWIQQRYCFCAGILKKYQTAPAKKKRSLASIIDEL